MQQLTDEKEEENERCLDEDSHRGFASDVSDKVMDNISGDTNPEAAFKEKYKTSEWLCFNQHIN